MSGRVFHAPFIQLHPGFELYAVLERAKNLGAEKYPGIKTFRSLSALLEDENVELVIVNTPNSTHYEFAKLALEAGKHVVVEKPFTNTVSEAEELIALAKKQNRQLSVFHNRRWDSDYKTVQEIVQKKVLGEIVDAEMHFDRFSEALSPKLHKETDGPGTGILYDLGSHLIDQALHLFGMPASVFADLAIVRPISQVEDYMDLILFYDGLRVRLKGSYLVREVLPSYILHGSKGSFIKPRSDEQEARLQKGNYPGEADWGMEPESGRGLLHTEIDGKIIREFIPSSKGSYLEFYDCLCRAINQESPLPVTAEDGLNVIRVIAAAYQSVEEKRVVEM